MGKDKENTEPKQSAEQARFAADFPELSKTTFMASVLTANVFGPLSERVINGLRRRWRRKKDD